MTPKERVENVMGVVHEALNRHNLTTEARLDIFWACVEAVANGMNNLIEEINDWKK